MENTGASQVHQHLVIRNARALIHGCKAVEKSDDLLLIEEGEGGERRPAQRVLYQRVQSVVRIECRRRAEERVLKAPADGKPPPRLNRPVPPSSAPHRMLRCQKN